MLTLKKIARAHVVINKSLDEADKEKNEQTQI